MLKPILFAITFFLCSNAEAKEVVLKNISTKELIKTFDKHEYEDYIYMPEWKYPPIFLTNLPKDFAQIQDQSLRNRLFLMIVGPLTLKVAQDTLKEREEVLKTEKEFRKNKKLTAEQAKLIEKKANKYNIFTRLKGYRRYDYIFTELKLKVDVVPPSILMAVAAIESNWGTSRVALEANSLYKEKVWYTDKGLEPEGEDEDKSYKYKIFPSLYDSIASYALRINSGVNYNLMRFERSEIRYREKPVFGRTVAHSMIFDSSLENFAGLLDYTITFYELTNFDESSLLP